MTGGAGFIGSHLVDRLIELGAKVTVVDNLSSGRQENINHLTGNCRFNFIEGDVRDENLLSKHVRGKSVIFHFAANPEVRIGLTDTSVDLQQNVIATYKLLEAIRKSGTVPLLVFASTSTVYGDAKKMPTPEDYGPLRPISMYGASKLACEGMISAFGHLFGLTSVILRFANIIGPRATHGVILDFIAKLRQDPSELEVLGDGTQWKSYLHVKDCVSGVLMTLDHANGSPPIFNVGAIDSIQVSEVARIVIDEMKLSGTRVAFLGGIEGRGWPGDVKKMLLDTAKLKAIGWKPAFDSRDSVRSTARELIKN